MVLNTHAAVIRTVLRCFTKYCIFDISALAILFRNVLLALLPWLSSRCWMKFG